MKSWITTIALIVAVNGTTIYILSRLSDAVDELADTASQIIEEDNEESSVSYCTAE